MHIYAPYVNSTKHCQLFCPQRLAVVVYRWCAFYSLACIVFSNIIDIIILIFRPTSTKLQTWKLHIMAATVNSLNCLCFLVIFIVIIVIIS